MCNPFTLGASLVAECAGACAGAAICTCCTKCCGYVGRNTSKHGSLLPYVVFVFMSGILCLCLRYWGQPMTIHLYIKDYALCTTDACYGYGAVFRISWALFLFFATHLIIVTIGGKRGYKVDQVNWLWKLLLWIVFIVVAYLIPDPFYDVYQWIARVVGGIFLVIQMILLIDFAYTWNEEWTSDRKGYFKSVLGVATLMYAASIAACALLFVYFTHQGSGGCILENFFIGFTLAVTVALSVLSISPLIDGGGLLPAAVITLYSFWLTYSALTSDPHECANVPNNGIAIQVVSIILAAASVSYAGYNAATSNSLFGGQSEEQLENAHIRNELQNGDPSSASYSNAVNISAPTSYGSSNVNGADNSIAPPPQYGMNSNSSPVPLDIEAQKASTGGPYGIKPGLVQHPAAPGLVPTDSPDNTDTAKLSSRSFRFHLFMCITAMYLAVLFTNWGSRQDASAIDSTQAYDLSLAAMWIKMGTQWITQLLFGWSLIAPKIMTSRDFR